VLAAAMMLVLIAAWTLPALLNVRPPGAALLTALLSLGFFVMWERYRTMVDDIRQYRLEFSEVLRRNGLKTETPKRAGFPRDHVDDRVFTNLRAEAALMEEALTEARRAIPQNPNEPEVDAYNAPTRKLRVVSG
jgi:hypothetical protein